MKMNGALGIIEVQGLVTAITATDAALKAANVTYVNYFKTGNGNLQVRLVGDVGAVQAAVAAGKAAALKCGMVTGVTVIPRPHEDLKKLIGVYGMKENTDQSKQAAAEAEPEEEPAPAAEAEPAEEPEPAAEVALAEEPAPAADAAPAEESAAKAAEAEPEEEDEAESAEPAPEEEPEPVREPEEEAERPEAAEEPAEAAEAEKEQTVSADPAAAEASGKVTCNICGDPKCTRLRGQPRKLCIHYKDKES